MALAIAKNAPVKNRNMKLCPTILDGMCFIYRNFWKNFKIFSV